MKKKFLTENKKNFWQIVFEVQPPHSPEFNPSDFFFCVDT